MARQRPARYVGPAGKERFWAAWFGLVRVGLGWVSGWVWVGLRARDFPTERVLSGPLNY